MNIGNFIKLQRIKSKLTQIQLAKALHVANTTISNYEHGISMPDLNTFMQLADIFKISFAPLISVVGDDIDKLDLYNTIYSELCGKISEIPETKLSFIPAKPEWKYKNLISENCMLLLESNPETFKSDDLVIAQIPNHSEHIYRIHYYNDNYYLVPENGPSYLNTVKINPNNINLERIVFIIQYP